MKKIISLVICAVMLFAITAHADVVSDFQVAGDVNIDGETDNKDITILFRYVSGGKLCIDEYAADCNGDDEINNKDVTQLFRYLSGNTSMKIKYGKDDKTIPLQNIFMTYVTADIYADPATAAKEGFKQAGNDKLSAFFAETTEFDPETWDVLAPKAFENVSEYVIRRAQGQYIEEVTVLKTTSRKGAGAVKAMAEYRCEKQRTNQDYKLYDDENKRNEKMIGKGVVLILNNFIVYLVTENTSASVARATDHVISNPNCSAADLYYAIVSEEAVS